MNFAQVKIDDVPWLLSLTFSVQRPVRLQCCQLTLTFPTCFSRRVVSQQRAITSLKPLHCNNNNNADDDISNNHTCLIAGLHLHIVLDACFISSYVE